MDREEPQISSTLRWQDASLPESISVADLDALILSTLKPQWRKMAMVVGKVGQACEEQSTPLECEIVAARIQALAEASQIESQGDLRMWRHSEVRLLSVGG